MATNLINLSNELATAVERTAASIVAVHGRRGIGSSGIAWRENFIVTSSEGIRVEEGIKLVLPDGRTAAAPASRTRRRHGSRRAGNGRRRSPSVGIRRRSDAQSRATGAGRRPHVQYRGDRIFRDDRQWSFRGMENVAGRNDRPVRSTGHLGLSDALGRRSGRRGG